MPIIADTLELAEATCARGFDDLPHEGSLAIDAVSGYIYCYRFDARRWYRLSTERRFLWGHTQSRPRMPYPGSRYFDTVLQHIVMWDGSGWTSIEYEDPELVAAVHRATNHPWRWQIVWEGSHAIERKVYTDPYGALYAYDAVGTLYRVRWAESTGKYVLVSLSNNNVVPPQHPVSYAQARDTGSGGHASLGSRRVTLSEVPCPTCGNYTREHTGVEGATVTKCGGCGRLIETSTTAPSAASVVVAEVFDHDSNSVLHNVRVYTSPGGYSYILRHNAQGDTPRTVYMDTTDHKWHTFIQAPATSGQSTPTANPATDFSAVEAEVFDHDSNLAMYNVPVYTASDGRHYITSRRYIAQQQNTPVIATGCTPRAVYQDTVNHVWHTTTEAVTGQNTPTQQNPPSRACPRCGRMVAPTPLPSGVIVNGNYYGCVHCGVGFAGGGDTDATSSQPVSIPLSDMGQIATSVPAARDSVAANQRLPVARGYRLTPRGDRVQVTTYDVADPGQNDSQVGNLREIQGVGGEGLLGQEKISSQSKFLDPQLADDQPPMRRKLKL